MAFICTYYSSVDAKKKKECHSPMTSLMHPSDIVR